MNDFTCVQNLLPQLRQLLLSNTGSANDAQALLALGTELHRQGELEAALAAFEKVARLGSPVLGVWHALATLRLALKRPQAALSACNEALAMAPDDADTLFNTAIVLTALADTAAAVHCYQRALSVDSAHRGALLNLVSLLLSGSRAIEAQGFSDAAVLHHPQDADCWFNHSEVMTSLNRHTEALSAYETALRFDPGLAKADVAIGVSLAALGRLADADRHLASLAVSQPAALAAFRSPLETDRVSAYPEIEAGRIALIAAYQRHRVCDWSKRGEFTALFRSVIEGRDCRRLDNPDLPFLAMALPLPGEYRRAMAEQVAGRITQQASGQSLVRPSARKPGPLRIGYLSGDFRQHATAWLMKRLPALHDRQRFEIFLYSSGPDDQSEIRKEIIAGSDHFLDARSFDDAALAQRIVRDGIDILVDLSGYTLYSRPGVLAMRPAVIQASYLVYLQTSGAPWIDYVLLDHQVLTARERCYWTERVVYLPSTLYLCDDQMPAGSIATRRETEGLPEYSFVFCCLNAAWKIDPDTFAAWMRILVQVPQAVLWLYADVGESEVHLRQAARSLGVDDRRLVFAHAVPHEQHLARYRLADVFLDTFSCNAHTTAIEALAAGVPVVTLPGETVVARVGASLLVAHNQETLIARNVDEYVAIACRLALDSDVLNFERSRLADCAASRLFATEARVREIERAYLMMWVRHEAGLATADFDVPEEQRGE